jgi:hypothetical protein
MNRDETNLFDVRVLERNLRRGTVSRKDYDKYLKGLPDRSANASWTRVWSEPAAEAAADQLDVSEPDEGVE